MRCILAFTDASPQESINLHGPHVWHTMAAVGLILEDDPFASGLSVSGIHGVGRLIRIPDPKRLAAALQPDARSAFRSWKNIRTPKRRRIALERLLSACRSGHCLFLSHSTLSHLAERVTDRYLSRYCSAIVQRSLLIGHPDYVMTLPSTGARFPITRQRLVSLTWIVHCLSIFLHKVREAFGNVNALFVHDNLPFNREEDIAIVQALLDAQDPGRIHFMTDRRQFEFAPTDNLAAATNDFITGRDSSIQTWIWKGGRPRNFYMTMDEENGSYARFI